MYRTEAQFQREVIRYAQSLGWQAYSIPDSRGATSLGFPDIVFGRPDRKPVFVELKLNHRNPTKHQLWWLTILGGELWRPRDWDRIKEVLGG